MIEFLIPPHTTVRLRAAKHGMNCEYNLHNVFLFAGRVSKLSDQASAQISDHPGSKVIFAIFWIWHDISDDMYAAV